MKIIAVIPTGGGRGRDRYLMDVDEDEIANLLGKTYFSTEMKRLELSVGTEINVRALKQLADEATAMKRQLVDLPNKLHAVANFLTREIAVLEPPSDGQPGPGHVIPGVDGP